MAHHDSSLSPQEILNRELILTWARKAWRSPALVSVEEFFHPECVVTGMSPTMLEGIAQVQACYQALHSQIEHQHADVSLALIRGDRFSLVMELQGTHRETNEDVVIEVGVFGRLKDGMFYQCHNVVDYSQMYAKLGILNVDQIRAKLG